MAGPPHNRRLGILIVADQTSREALSNLMGAISACLEVIAEDAAAKAYPEIGPGRYNLSLSAS